MKKVSILGFLLLIFLPILLFQQSLFSYFSQDDFFHLRVIMDKKVADLPGFFLSRQQEYSFYRPLSREFFNLVMYQLFALNPLPFHLVNLILIIFNTFGTLFLVKKISQQITTAFLAGVLYSVNAVHSVELYYLASVQTLLATFLMLVTILIFLSFLETLNKKIYFFSLLIFVLALLSHETAIILPGILFLLVMLLAKNKNQLIHYFFYLVPFFLLVLLYFSRTSLFNGLPGEQVYQPIFSIKSIFNSLMWYVLWSFNLPEMLVDFIGPNFAVNPNLIKWYGYYLKIVLPLLLGIALSILYFFFLLRKRNQILKISIFYFLSFLTALLPFLLFPQHKSIYYLSFAMIWFSSLLALVIAPFWQSKKIWIMLIIFGFIIISYLTAKLNGLTYWAAKRAVAAKYILNDFQKHYLKLEKNSVIYIKNDPNYPFIAKEWGSSSKQAFYILSGSDAFKLLYHDLTLRVYFEDVNQAPDNDVKEIVYYLAKFPF